MPEVHKIYAPGEALPAGIVGSPCPAGDGHLYIRFLNIGLGNCTYVICPNGKRLLIDAGSMDKDGLNIGDVQNHLDYDGITGNLYVDVLVISHAHQDHQNMLGNLVWGSPIQAIYYGANAGGNAMGNEYNTLAFRQWWWYYANTPFVQHLQVNVANPVPQLICEGGVAGGLACNITAVAASVVPYPGSSQGFENRKNTSSIVIKIDFGNDHILITADATADTERFMVNTAACNAMLPSNVLMVPHHGSDTSSTQAFINRVAPETVLISCINGNRHQLPKLPIVNRYINAPSVNTLPTYQDIGTYDTAYWPAYRPIQTRKDVWQTGTAGESFYYDFTGV